MSYSYCPICGLSTIHNDGKFTETRITFCILCYRQKDKWQGWLEEMIEDVGHSVLRQDWERAAQMNECVRLIKQEMCELHLSSLAKSGNVLK